jgi:hypothetical protein
MSEWVSEWVSEWDSCVRSLFGIFEVLFRYFRRIDNPLVCNVSNIRNLQCWDFSVVINDLFNMEIYKNSRTSRLLLLDGKD